MASRGRTNKWQHSVISIVIGEPEAVVTSGAKEKISMNQDRKPRKVPG